MDYNPVKYIISRDKFSQGMPSVYVARDQIDLYRAVDKIRMFYREYGGRIMARDALLFDDAQEAQRYLSLSSASDLRTAGYGVRKYDINMGLVEMEMEEER